MNRCQEKYKEEKSLHTEKKIGIKKKIGRLTQRESAILTRWKSLVRIQYRPLINSRGYGFRSVALFVFVITPAIKHVNKFCAMPVVTENDDYAFIYLFSGVIISTYLFEHTTYVSSRHWPLRFLSH